MADNDARIPAIVNMASGSADAAREALEASGAFDVREVPPAEIGATVKKLVAEGTPRILVSGGDGTIAAAATALAGSKTQLAVLPGGTLNHFARDLGISVVAAEALELASGESCRGVDVGTVNGRVFLNTSSVGAYVRFVRVREALEKRFGYRLASTFAALRILFQFRLVAVELEVEGKTRIYRTPLVFIGVGERELQLPTLGNRVAGGRSGLHVMVVRGRSRARLLALGLAAVAKGVRAVARTPEFDSFLVDRCTIDFRRGGPVSVDGELVTLAPPLEFALHRGALTVVCPAPEPLAEAVAKAEP